MRRSSVRVATPEEVCRYGRTLPRGLLPPIAGGAGYALVGSVGAASLGASGAAVTPAWGASSSQTANDLLICWVGGDGTGVTTPATPTGWNIGKTVVGTSTCMTVFFKIAAGGDAAPTIAAVSGKRWTVQLAEFSGNNTPSAAVLDQTGSGSATSGASLVVTAGAADKAAGELVIVGGYGLYTANGTETMSNTLNNGATSTDSQDNATSATRHHCFGWGITTDHAAADSDTFAHSSSAGLTGICVVLASFRLPDVRRLLRHSPRPVQNRPSARGRF